jgi:hypothetical protein
MTRADLEELVRMLQQDVDRAQRLREDLLRQVNYLRAVGAISLILLAMAPSPQAAIGILIIVGLAEIACQTTIHMREKKIQTVLDEFNKRVQAHTETEE